MRLTFVLLVLTNFACACFGAKLYLRYVSSVPAKPTNHILFRNNTLYVYNNARDVDIECFLPNEELSNADYEYAWVSNNRTLGTQAILRLRGLMDPAQKSNTIYTCSLSKKMEDGKVGEKYADDVKFVMYKDSSDLTTETNFNKSGYVDNSKNEPNFIEFNSSLELELCCKNKIDDSEFEWFLNGEALTKKENYVEFKNDTKILHLKQLTNASAGVYMCVTKEKNLSKQKIGIFNVFTNPSFKLKHGASETSENKMEDHEVTISPDLLGNSPLSYTWLYRKEDDKTKPEEIITTDGTIRKDFEKNHQDLAKRMKFFPNGDVINGQLEIKNLKKEDRATFIAQINVTDYRGDRVLRFSTLVRVKGRLDALWPFLGIVAEVIILVAIIFIYERRRAKRDAESDDTPDQKQPLASANNDNVRKR